MAIWVESILALDSAEPHSLRRLSANSEIALSASLKGLPAGERGWITIPEARALFSPMDDQYAFGEMDRQDKTNLAAFAAQIGHRSAFDFMPSEGRLYFTRQD
jgi:hypothetical protein